MTGQDVTRQDSTGNTLLNDKASDSFCSNSLFDLLAQGYVGPDQASNERWQASVEAARDKRRRYVEARGEWYSCSRHATE